LIPNCRRIFGARAPHLAALLLRSSLTHQRMGSLRSSAQDHDLGHPDTEYLAVNRNQSSSARLRWTPHGIGVTLA